jgi:hypothetical protein
LGKTFIAQPVVSHAVIAPSSAEMTEVGGRGLAVQRSSVGGDSGGDRVSLRGDRVSEEREGAGKAGASPPQRSTRRLSDKILVAFHQACDQGDYEVAWRLLQVLELILSRRPATPDSSRRRSIESLVAAHERLWHLRHPGAEEE